MHSGAGSRAEDGHKKLDQLLAEFSACEPGAPDALARLAQFAGRPLPPDFISFLRSYGGGEGFIGDNYVMLWSASDIPKLNEAYNVSEFAPGLMLFGSDGGGEGYAFDHRLPTTHVVRVPFVGMDLKYVRPVANTFLEFLHLLTVSNAQTSQ
jgi:hypothetical protein